ncbi:hypothetical protein [Nocardiopsis suaedae]|uniref:Secreted protein n=1 Tax=Nocardiopsis suaedae TaxID=3018444 RepID=A0ABT4TR19_9ACTN|nr:hypothetical protein [Nocardiopsis suaedae]MDA2807128.1 hypothetical protein [Nocardiopsis suaedae]
MTLTRRLVSAASVAAASAAVLLSAGGAAGGAAPSQAPEACDGFLRIAEAPGPDGTAAPDEDALRLVACETEAALSVDGADGTAEYDCVVFTEPTAERAPDEGALEALEDRCAELQPAG